ncbi:PH domain-containing protein [Treponema sp. R6D11]
MKSFDFITSQFNGTTGLITLVVLFVVLIGCIGLIFFTKNPSVIIDNGFLTIKSLFYGKTIAINEINVDGIKQLNLSNDKDYRIKIRTNGIGLPGYYVGWMRLNNGHKALVYIKDKTNVVLIPTNDYDVLISGGDVTVIKDSINKTLNF